MGQRSVEPWRTIELAASAEGTTAFSIPERVAGEECGAVISRSGTASITEVVVAYECRQLP